MAPERARAIIHVWSRLIFIRARGKFFIGQGPHALPANVTAVRKLILRQGVNILRIS